MLCIEVASAPLRTGQCVVVDRFYDRDARKHTYEVAIASHNGATIDQIVARALSRAEARQLVDRIVAEWAA